MDLSASCQRLSCRRRSSLSRVPAANCNAPATHKVLKDFQSMVWKEGKRLYRDLPWRRTTCPYEVWISEVMLQQTQVSRVERYWERWITRFPAVEVLAESPTAEVLEAWQGMGYNRRALALQKAARIITEKFQGTFPQDTNALLSLPGIGSATAAGLLAFAFNKPSVYIETNVRTVFLHELFPGASAVPDKELVPLVEKTCPGYNGATYSENRDPRMWYYALLDYGAFLKKQVPNPSRRSKTHARQSTFEGSRRQKRAALIRILLDDASWGKDEENLLGPSTDEIALILSAHEQKAGRPKVDALLVQSILEDLEKEGFCHQQDGTWII